MPVQSISRPPGPIEHPLQRGQAPEWASEWGHDELGPFAVLELDGEKGPAARQRFRYIPPGSFVMGSPADEPGRDSDEGPQHLVTLTQGFWMADTPCTQALWQAVMGSNPSRFQADQHPVEKVSWDTVQKFLETLNARVPGLEATLPTEAQWEYACRADSRTALYPTAKSVGTLEILGENNAPALNAIAWYGGNSQAPKGIENAENSSGWPNKEFPHKRASTQPVAGKLANEWGLHDMLGNVWEWCADGLRDYRDQAETDPVGLTKKGGSRVIRGGGWGSGARGVRCALRFHGPAGLEDYILSFRLVRVQERS
jgi:formylglycine-generating enzyme required for sulfatase activity